MFDPLKIRVLLNVDWLVWFLPPSVMEANARSAFSIFKRAEMPKIICEGDELSNGIRAQSQTREVVLAFQYHHDHVGLGQKFGTHEPITNLFLPPIDSALYRSYHYQQNISIGLLKAHGSSFRNPSAALSKTDIFQAPENSLQTCSIFGMKPQPTTISKLKGKTPASTALRPQSRRNRTAITERWGLAEWPSDDKIHKARLRRQQVREALRRHREKNRNLRQEAIVAADAAAAAAAVIAAAAATATSTPSAVDAAGSHLAPV
jgi:hypothetical protein